MCMYRGKQVHFFGFRGYEYVSAIRVWGHPDFIPPVHERRSQIEYDPSNDIGIFANKETEELIHSYRREYADMNKKVDIVQICVMLFILLENRRLYNEKNK